MQTFINDESAYLAWVHANPTGFVATMDHPQSVPQYPMVHRTRHKLIWGGRNYTQGLLD